jgi:hypothetical protein
LIERGRVLLRTSEIRRGARGKETKNEQT